MLKYYYKLSTYNDILLICLVNILKYWINNMIRIKEILHQIIYLPKFLFVIYLCISFWLAYLFGLVRLYLNLRRKYEYIKGK
jgi:hypothetical protein